LLRSDYTEIGCNPVAAGREVALIGESDHRDSLCRVLVKYRYSIDTGGFRDKVTRGG
jgi:hypothetical protein